MPVAGHSSQGFIPLPPWPMWVACEKGALNMDYGLAIDGNKTDVRLVHETAAVLLCFKREIPTRIF